MPTRDKHIVDALYSSFPDPVVIVDAARVIASANSATARHFGYDLSELVGKPARLLYASDEDYDACLNHGPSLPSTRDPDGVYRYRRKGGQTFSARLRLTAFPRSDGQDDGLIGIIHDISDFIKLDQQRRRADDALDTALQAIPEGFAIFDPQERLLVFNDAYRRVCGIAGDRLHVGMTAENIIRAAHASGNYPLPPAGHPETEAWIDARLADFRNVSEEAPVFPYGNGRWLRVEHRRTKDGNTVALRIDVTDLKEAELALNRQRLDYYTLVQHIPDFITRISVDWRFTFVNDRYANFLGRSPCDIIGQSVFQFVPESDHVDLTRSLLGLTEQSPVHPREQCHVQPDGHELWVQWSNIAIFDGGTLTEFVTVGRDITALKQQEARIARQSAELRRKNEALTQFTGTVSHDLKAPLRHLSMFSEMIHEDILAGRFDELPVYCHHLRQSARRMDQLIDSLLDYAQIADQIGKWQVVRLQEVIADAILNLDSFVRETDARIDVGGMPVLKGDPELLKRLCQNVIGNAIKYRKPNETPHLRIYALRDDDGTARVFFEDNGIGIDPRFDKKIFDVFQRLHRDESIYPGTGIGLSLAKRIAESHNGSIELDTTFTGGARFVVTLPVSR